MVARAASFKQADLSRAIKAMVAAGLEIGPVKIDPSGSIIILPAKKGAATDKSEDDNEWDDVLK
ncbi:hypothetical protein [Mesorhizobium japonicum]|uniref:Msr9534 protein n=1 Tax=Mesorhizobium japonicum (strain LMG 29417 / CECT 9101 / MAFF 303099) TaxID=266835 RepID=Q98PB4_RHILO|nr:hypothetical protein [Mesorhizobium japonicum]BAB54741.1 msr9534 [Mesorhizobium japonicum MAFF 303099]